MQFLLENILNMTGGIVGMLVSVVSYIGFKHTSSPSLFRLTIAFFSISMGFFIIWSGFMLEDFVFKTGNIDRVIETTGIIIQTIGYFLLAFSHTIKSFFPKTRQFRTIVFPLFISIIYIEHLLRSISFILLVYAAIETMLAYASGQKKGTLLVGLGLSLLAGGEFIGWYSLIFLDSPLYYISILIKIIGLIFISIPIGKIAIKGHKLDSM